MWRLNQMFKVLPSPPALPGHAPFQDPNPGEFPPPTLRCCSLLSLHWLCFQMNHQSTL